MLRLVEPDLLTVPALRLVGVDLFTVLPVRDVLDTVPVERVVVVPRSPRTVVVVPVLLVTLALLFTVVPADRVTDVLAVVPLLTVVRAASLATSVDRVAVIAPEPLVARTLEGVTPVILRKL